MQLVVHTDGSIRCLYDEALDLGALGTCHLNRASFVEPDLQGRWTVDLGPVGGPTLGPFALRSQGLAAEQAWLERHILI